VRQYSSLRVGATKHRTDIRIGRDSDYGLVAWGNPYDSSSDIEKSSHLFLAKSRRYKTPNRQCIGLQAGNQTRLVEVILMIVPQI